MPFWPVLKRVEFFTALTHFVEMCCSIGGAETDVLYMVAASLTRYSSKAVIQIIDWLLKSDGDIFYSALRNFLLSLCLSVCLSVCMSV